MFARAFLAAILAAVLLAPSAYADQKVVRVRATSYEPQTVEIQAGDTVEWSWEASLHTVTALDGSFDSDRGCTDRACRAAGRVFTHKFSKPGLFAYRCKVQPAMLGNVRVVEAKAQQPPPSGPDRPAPATGGQPAQKGPGAGPAAPPPQPPPQAAPPPRRRMAVVPGLSYANAPPAAEPVPHPVPPAVAPRRDALSILPEGGPLPIPEEPAEPPAQLALEVPAPPPGPPAGLVVGIAIVTLLVTAGAFGKFVLFRPPWS